MFNKSFQDNIATGAYTNIQPWLKIGYNAALALNVEDIWPLSSIYGNSGLFLAAPTQMEIIGSENVVDIGTIIRGSRSVPVTSDAGGSTTTLVHSTGDFTNASPVVVAIGDILLLDPAGTVAPNIPEWGYITGVANTTLTCSGGFSSGGTGTSRKYLVIDQSTHAGALVLKVDYLTSSYLERSLLIPTNGTTAVLTLNDAGAALEDLYRINSFRVVATGTNYIPTGYWQIQTKTGGTVWSYIALGQNRARNNCYTVPAGKTLYINKWDIGFGKSDETKFMCIRAMLKMNMEPSTTFNTGNIWYPFEEKVISNQQIYNPVKIDIKIPAKIDIRIQAQGYTGVTAGIVCSSVFGHLVA